MTSHQYRERRALIAAQAGLDGMGPAVVFPRVVLAVCVFASVVGLVLWLGGSP